MDIINNQIKLLGDYDSVKEILKLIKSDESLVDFNKIEPMEEDQDDLVFDDYTNFFLNVYLSKNLDKKEDLVKTFKFIGLTRKVPFEFYELTQEELKNAKSKYQTKEIEKDIEVFLEKIKNKSIFNAYMVRDTLWGTGTGAINPKVGDNTIEFVVYNSVPLKLFEKISKMYTNIKIEYIYQIEEKRTYISIFNGQSKVRLDENMYRENASLYKLINNNVKI